MSIDPLDGILQDTDTSVIPLGKMARPLRLPVYDVDSELSLLHSETVEETLIPTETSIKDAKDRRERLRKTGAPPGGDDFISLSVTRTAEEWQGPHPESRLMREDDDLGEGDDGACHVLIAHFDPDTDAFDLQSSPNILRPKSALRWVRRRRRSRRASGGRPCRR